MKRLFISAYMVTLGLSSALAQSPQSHFWDTPGAIIRDSGGNIVYREIKDPRTATVRVWDHGTWLTYHYQPNSEHVISVETPDGTEEYLYDGSGKWAGVTVHGQGRPLTIRATRQQVAVDGLPPVSIDQDTAGRDVAVTQAGRRIVAMEYRQNGELQSVSVGPLTFTLTREGSRIHEQLTANGRTLTSVTPRAADGAKHEFPISLDTVADALGLPENWSEGLATSRSATGSVVTVHNDSRVVARLVEFGGMRVGYDAAGVPLFYDIQLNYGAAGGYTDARLTMAYNSVLPKRLVITANGRVEAYVTTPADGAIQSFGTSTVDGQPTYTFKVFNPPSSSAMTAIPGALSAGVAQTASRVFRSPGHAVRSEMMYQCGSYEVWSCCDTCGYGGGAYCWNSYDPVYCEGGGSVSPPPDDGGGGGGSGYTSDQVTGDTTMRFKVSQGLSSANTRLNATACSQDLFAHMTLDDGTAASTVLGQRGSDAKDWLDNKIQFTNGTAVRDATGAIPCDTGIAAWTHPGDTTVHVCSAFNNLDSSTAGTILIHEELHTLGVSEKPGDPNAQYTADGITQQVRSYCGS